MTKKKTFSAKCNYLEQQVWAMAEPLALAGGCVLLDVEFVKEVGNWYLRLYIDREPPVDLNCCQSLSEQISAALDRADPLGQSYFLEVSSPGLNRPLKRESDFEHYNGRKILITLYAPWQGIKEYCGILRGLTEEVILVEQLDKITGIPRELVAKARLAEL